MQIDPAYPAERDFIWFSYDRILDQADTVASVTSIDITDRAALDGTPNARKSGSPVIEARRVGQWFEGLVAGADYLIVCTATMTSTRRLSIPCVLPVRAP